MGIFGESAATKSDALVASYRSARVNRHARSKFGNFRLDGYIGGGLESSCAFCLCVGLLPPRTRHRFAVQRGLMNTSLHIPPGVIGHES